MNEIQQRKVIDIETNEEIIIDVDVSKMFTLDDGSKRSIVYHRKVKNYLTDITKWRAEGKGANEIAYILDISASALYKYRQTVPELAEAWDVGNEILADSLETALYKEGLGYNYTEEALTKTGRVVKIEKYARPNVAASKFVLPNIRPHKWKTRVEPPKQGIVSGVNIDALSKLSATELKQYLDTVAKMKEIESETTDEREPKEST